MADYFPVLSDAVGKLENNTGEARRAVYERARAAIVRQLRAIDPPLAEDVIARERMQLEEAIRKVEAKAGGAAAPTPAAPPPPPRRPEPVEEPPPAARRPEASRPQAVPQPQDRGPQAARPAKRADGRPIIRTADGGAKAAPKQRSGALIGLLAIAAIAIVVGLVTARGRIAALLGGGSQTASTTTQPTAAAKPEEGAPQPAGKSDDRMPQQDAQAPAAPAQPQTEPQEPAPTEQRQAAVEAPAAAAPAPDQAGPLVAQRATLYEEGPNQQSGEAVGGTVVWRTESVNGGQSQPLETAIRGDIDIPGRKLRATMVIRRNADATLPASHTVEVQFTLPDDFANAGISNVPGILMKANESARGAAVSGLSVRVTNGFFLVGLSNLDTERSVNEQLLRDRGWVDIPILYDNGRRAVLTLEKGTPGMQAFTSAFTSWANAPTASNQPPR